MSFIHSLKPMVAVAPALSSVMVLWGVIKTACGAADGGGVGAVATLGLSV